MKQLKLTILAGVVEWDSGAVAAIVTGFHEFAAEFVGNSWSHL